MEPLLSVIVPVYKTELYLRKCVDSILTQTYANLEVILVDDASPDGCGAICDEYSKIDSRVKVIHKENQGVSAARNVGLDMASGEYITFVDSDDWLENDLYQNAMGCAPFSVLIFGCTDVYEASEVKKINNTVSSKDILLWTEDTEAIEKMFENSLMGYACNKIYHRDILKDIRFVDAKLREDLLFHLEAFAQTKELRILNQPGYYYYHHGSSSLTGRYSGEVPDIVSVAEKMTQIHPDLPPSDSRRIANRLIKAYITDALHKFVFFNSLLTNEEKKAALRVVLGSKAIRHTLGFYSGEGMLFTVFTLCYQLRNPWILYQVLKRIWKA